jgi:hypothetical protein
VNRRYRILGWTYVALCAALLVGSRGEATPIAPAAPVEVPHNNARPSAPTPSSDAAAWFRRMKPYCNAVEVNMVQRGEKAPATIPGAGYNAACFALAGRIDDARRIIDALPAEKRARAANIVFEVGHPVADAGDDRSAGPIMELVVDYVPNHYMALYHAGMSEYMLGQRDLAKRNLEEFLKFYNAQDGWTSNARGVLERLSDPKAAANDRRRPREP